jgi:hypothetical protein
MEEPIWHLQGNKIGSRHLPFAFTETGVAQLSGVLNSKQAILINNQIMRVFIKMLAMLMDTLILKLDIEEIKKNFKVRIKILNCFSAIWTN